MSTSAARTSPQPTSLLENGARMTQTEFHRRYEAYPDHVKFELIEGIVYMASPLGLSHGQYHPQLGGAFWLYETATPGVEVLDNATTILGPGSEPQPDLGLRVLPAYGGRTRHNEDNYLVGGPELLAEIADSTRSIDMHKKKDVYDEAGVLEYVVLCVEEHELHWFDFKSRKAIKPNREGIYRSKAFPGLWINSQALLERDSARIRETILKGLSSPQHAAFVKRLQAARGRKRS